MLESRYLTVLEARSVDAFRTASVGFAQQLGFNVCSNIVVIDRVAGPPDFVRIDNVPDDYQAAFQDLSQGKRDPVAQHCKFKSFPITWGLSTYQKPGLIDIWERSTAFGLSHGVAVAMHMPNGLHFMVGFDRDQPLPDCPEELHRMTAEVQLYAAHAQDSIMGLVLPQPQNDGGHTKLTPRELECLRWTMEGKTAWELGCILGIAEHTAVRHLYNATHKLEAINKHQAVLKALRLRIIW